MRFDENDADNDEFEDIDEDKRLSCSFGDEVSKVLVLGLGDKDETPHWGVGDDELVLLEDDPGAMPLLPFEGLSNIACNFGCSIFFM